LPDRLVAIAPSKGLAVRITQRAPSLSAPFIFDSDGARLERQPAAGISPRSRRFLGGLDPVA
jgi:hypothetical protein